MTGHPLEESLATTAARWAALLPFALWVVAEDGRIVYGQPCAHVGDGACPTLSAQMRQRSASPQSGTCCPDQPYLFLCSDGIHGGMRLGASGYAPAAAAAVEAALVDWLATATTAAGAADQVTLEAWGHRALQDFYEAFAQGSAEVPALLATASAELALALPARVLAVVLLDEQLGSLEVAAVHGAPLAAVRHFVEGYGPKLGFAQVAGDPVFLPPLEGGWGPGWAASLDAPGGQIGLLLAWSDQGMAPFWQARLARIRRQLALLVGAARLESEWQESLLGIFASVAASVDAKAPYTTGQSGRATLLALAIADEMGAAISRRDLRLAGLLHDIGNVAVPDAILAKAGTLSADELARMRQHPETAARMLAEVPRLAEVRKAIHHHHERWDGAGYPERLRGAQIPLGARILGVADAMIALLSPRPYRDALAMTEAIEEVRRGLGSQFDPEVGEALFRCLERSPGLLAALSSVTAPSGRSGGTGSLGKDRRDEDGPPLRLPVMPETIQRLHALSQAKPKPVGEVISLLSGDPALSARIMRYANSRKLGFARQITTVSQVVMLLGVERVCNLALGFGLYDSFLSGEQPQMNGEFVGPHGLLTATGCRMLCQMLGQDAGEDEAFMVGMLHDMGRAILAQDRPEPYAVVQERHAQGEDLVALERALLGTDHAAVGAEAARKWGLPPRLVQAIAQHHEPERAALGSLATIVAVASEIALYVQRKELVPAAAQARFAGYLGVAPAQLDPVLRTLGGEANPILLSLRPERR